MSVKLSPVFNGQVVDANGAPAVGYKLFTYAAGSSTKQTTYCDKDGLVPQTNPIILDSDGRPTNGPIWLTVGQTYKFVLTGPNDADPPTSPVDTIDGVTGVNDASISISQWQSSGVTPTYVSTNSFTLAGDQTSEFHKGRQLQFTTSGGTVYGKIINSVFTTLTTITVFIYSSGALDSGLSAVNLSILRADTPVLPNPIEMLRSTVAATATTTPIWDRGNGNIQDWTGTPTITDFPAAPQAGAQREVYPAAGTIITNAGNISVQGNANYTVVSGDKLVISAVTTTTFYVTIVRKDGLPIPVLATPPIRQTVLSGPVDTSGLPNFGGSTGGTTVTASGTLTPTAANGAANRTGSITNPAWTGLSTNGTMYLYLDIAADGSCTTGSTTLAPTYRWGGADVTTSGQFTFNIQEMVGKVGNGSAAVQTYRVFVGEVSVAAGVVTAIAWYALMGRHISEWFSVALSTAYVKNHNIGDTNVEARLYWGSSADDELRRATIYFGAEGDGGTSRGRGATVKVTRCYVRIATGNFATYSALATVEAESSTGGFYKVWVKRTW